MEEMYVACGTAFADFAERTEEVQISAAAKGLYCTLLYRFAKVGFPRLFHISNSELMELTGANSHHTINRWRNELVEAGFIEIAQGSKGKETQYTLKGRAENAQGRAENAQGRAENAQGRAENARFIYSLNNYISSDSKIPNINKSAEYREYGEYGWVKLTDLQYERLLSDLGEAELARCIAYVDESAQSNGNKNKWKDWNLVLRKCNRGGWGKSAEEKSAASFITPRPEYIPQYDI